MRVVDVADDEETSRVLQSMCSGTVPSDVWMEFSSKFRDWEAQQGGPVNPVAAAPHKPKTAFEQAIDGYYNAIYAEMDARDVARLAEQRDGDREGEVEGEGKTESEE